MEILYESDSSDEIQEKEIEFIKLYGRSDLNQGPLVNLTSGGKQNFEISQITREKIGKLSKGKSSWMKGRHHSEETKKKISQVKKGKKQVERSQEWRDKLSKAFKNRKIPKWQCDLLKKRNTGNKYATGKRSDEFRSRCSQLYKGRVLSEESKKKLSESVKASWIKRREKCSMSQIG